MASGTHLGGGGDGDCGGGMGTQECGGGRAGTGEEVCGESTNSNWEGLDRQAAGNVLGLADALAMVTGRELCGKLITVTVAATRSVSPRLVVR